MTDAQYTGESGSEPPASPVILRRITDWSIRLTVDDAFGAAGRQPEPTGNQLRFGAQLPEDALCEARRLVRPVVLARQFAIHGRDGTRLALDGGSYDMGQWLAGRLQQACDLVAAVCTIGPSLETHCRDLVGSDPVAALMLDALGNAALEDLVRQARRLFQAEACARGLEGSLYCCPGSVGWPTEEAQPLVFALLDLDTRARGDVRLLPSMVMQPLKSLSFVMGLTRQHVGSEQTCDACPAVSVCRYKPAQEDDCS
jgi:hypothetical protein